MFKSEFYQTSKAVALAGLLLLPTGCKDLPGSPEHQGAAIGGVSGAVAGAAVGGSEHRLLGALLGGAIGAGGGYVIGANKDRILGSDTQAAEQASQSAVKQPATARDVNQSNTADLNRDGFVTMDEVVAMHQAGLSPQQMISRLEATGQVFELTADQQQYLTSQGVSPTVVNQMNNLNRGARDEILRQQNQDVISRPQ